MKLLNIPGIPGTTPIQYSNQSSKEKWEGKILRASKTYPQMEVLTVQHGVRECMISHQVRPENLGLLINQMAQKGLVTIPITKEGVGGGFHTASSPGRDYGYRLAISKTIEGAERLVHAHLKKDEVEIGRLLGFPEESCEFFKNIWEAGYFDPIWQQAMNSHEYHTENSGVSVGLSVPVNTITLDMPSKYKVISSAFRYIGVRILSHMPKSFCDEPSLEVANKWVETARYLKVEGIEDNIDILNLPYSWDCLKGVAIVSTPVFKFSTESVPCYPKHVVNVTSDYYPEEAPKGVRFPWKLGGGCS